MRTLALPSLPRPDKSLLLLALLVIGILFFAAFSGAVVALGNKILLLPILAILGLFTVLVMPATWILWLLFIALFVVLGPVVYFSGFSQLHWLPPLMSVVFLIHIAIHAIRGRSDGATSTTPGFVYLLVLYLLVAAFATAIDEPALGEVINASRYYFFMWPVMLVFMLGVVRPDTIEKLWKALLAIVLLQVPFVIYQYFFVARQSLRLSPWDAVVGTFPGNIEGGGQSAAMGTMMLIVMLAAIALWRRHMLHGVWAGLVVMAGIGTLALAEVKAVVLLLPIAIGLYYRREMMRRPFESLFAFMVAGTLVAALFLGYERLHYSAMPSVANPNLLTAISDRILHTLSPETEALAQYQIGRVTHLVVWWDINVGKGDIQHSLFGYGAGATQITNLGAGEIARRFPYAMDVSSSTILLWETGLLGHLVFFALLMNGSWLSDRLSRNQAIPDIHQVLLRVGAVGLLILAITLPYKSFAVRSVPIQFLIMLMLGQAAYWSRMLPNAIGKAAATERRESVR